MRDADKLQAELEKFGLTKNQAVIYLALVRGKELRIQDLAKLTGIPRSSVYESLKGLFELGIAEEIVEDHFKKIRPYSVGAMHHGLDERVLEMQRLKSDLHALEKTLSLAKPENPPGKAVVHYYKGRSGARQAYWNSLKAKDTVYVMSDWGRGRYVGMQFYEKFVAETRARKIKERVLINLTEYTRESIRQFTYPGSPISRTRFEDIRYLDEGIIKIKGDVLIYNDIYTAIFLHNVSITGFEIESLEFVQTQRAIYETLWQLAKPLPRSLKN